MKKLSEHKSEEVTENELFQWPKQTPLGQFYHQQTVIDKASNTIGMRSEILSRANKEAPPYISESSSFDPFRQKISQQSKPDDLFSNSIL